MLCYLKQRMGMLMLQTIPKRDKYTVRTTAWNLDGADKVMLCFVDCESLRNLVNKTNLLHSFFSIFIFINLFMFWTMTGPSLGDTTVLMQHLLLVILCGWLSGVQDGIHSRPKCVEIDKYTKNKLFIKLVLFRRLYRDARSTKCKI
jgi:hypothetical protein